jgi:hypothetical protein
MLPSRRLNQHPLIPELFELLVACTVRAVIADLRDRGNPDRDSTDRTDVACADADFGGEGLEEPA